MVGAVAGAGRFGPLRMGWVSSAFGVASGIQPREALHRDGESQSDTGGLQTRDQLRVVRAISVQSDRRSAGKEFEGHSLILQAIAARRSVASGSRACAVVERPAC